MGERGGSGGGSGSGSGEAQQLENPPPTQLNPRERLPSSDVASGSDESNANTSMHIILACWCLLASITHTSVL